MGLLDELNSIIVSPAPGTSGGGGGGDPTDLNSVEAPTTVTITSSTGTNAVIPAADASNAGVFLPTEKTKLAGIATGATANSTDAFLLDRANHTGTQAQSTIVGLATTLGLKADLVDGKVPANQLPSFVDDVLEFADFASLPVTGESGKIYVTLDTNLTYRWSGSAYVQISESLALGETSTTAYQGDRGKIAYDHSQLTSGNPHGTTKADIELGNVPNLDTSTTANITDSTDKRFVTDADATKLDGIEPGAEANIEHGLISGGVLTVNGGDNSRFDISDGTGLIVDQYTDPLNPVRYEISWTGLTAQIVTNLATSDKTYILIDNTGAVVQLTTFPTEAERRDNILLGQLGHSNNTSIGGVIFDPDIASSPISQIRDIAAGIGPINQGNVISPNGANLQLNKSAGSIIKLGANYGVDHKAPTEVTIAGASAFSWRYRTQTGAGATASLIDPNNYDNAGTITALAANKYTNQRVFLATNGNVVIQYGQIVYSSFSAAVTGVQEDIANFVRFPNLDDNFVLIAVITLARGATDLSNSSQAKFFKPSKFGETVGAVAGTSVTNLQQAYSNSPDPEVLIVNPLTLKANSGNDTNNIVEVQNGAGSVTFTVTGNGAITASSLTIDGDAISKADNLIINGNFVVSDKNENASQTIIAGDPKTYPINRWYMYCAGANVSAQRIAGSGQSEYQYQITGDASATDIRIGQRISAEDSYKCKDQTCSFSFDTKHSVASSLTVEFYRANTRNAFGTILTPTRTLISSQSISVTTTEARYTASVSIPSTAIHGVEVVLKSSGAGIWVVGDLQFEIGNASSFKREKKSVVEAHCLPRFEVIKSGGAHVATPEGGMAFVCSNYGNTTRPYALVPYAPKATDTPAVIFATGNALRYVSSSGIYSPADALAYSVKRSFFILSATTAPVASFGWLDNVGDIYIEDEL